MKIIAITGKKKHGKTTVAEMVQRELGQTSVVVSFADALKREIIEAINVVNNRRGYEPIHYSFLENNKDDFRLIMQGWGTNLRRKHYSNEYWINQLTVEIGKYERLGYKYAIIPDVRFLNEAKFVKNKEGILIRVVRNANNQDMHESEIEMDKIEPDYSIDNTGTLSELSMSVERVMIRGGLK